MCTLLTVNLWLKVLTVLSPDNTTRLGVIRVNKFHRGSAELKPSIHTHAPISHLRFSWMLLLCSFNHVFRFGLTFIWYFLKAFFLSLKGQVHNMVFWVQQRSFYKWTTTLSCPVQSLIVYLMFSTQLSKSTVHTHTHTKKKSTHTPHPLVPAGPPCRIELSGQGGDLVYAATSALN